jgi:hypothetical protein
MPSRCAGATFCSRSSMKRLDPGAACASAIARRKIRCDGLRMPSQHELKNAEKISRRPKCCTRWTFSSSGSLLSV